MSLKAIGDKVQTGQIIQMPLKNSSSLKSLDRRQKSHGFYLSNETKQSFPPTGKKLILLWLLVLSTPRPTIIVLKSSTP